MKLNRRSLFKTIFGGFVAAITAQTAPRSIFDKPTRRVRYIQLNYIKTRTGLKFDDIIGKI